MKSVVKVAAVLAAGLLGACSATAPGPGRTVWINEQGWICDGTACYPPKETLAPETGKLPGRAY